MARRSSTGKGSGAGKARPAAAEVPPELRLIEAALDLAGKQGWRHTGIGEIAKAADLTLAQAYALHPSKASLLAAIFRHFNQLTLTGAEEEGTPRDRLFDLLMRRFDALKPYRAALKSITRDSIGDPISLCAGPAFLNSMGWILEAAGISVASWRGPGRILALVVLYASVFPTFLADEGEDLAKTMAVLDRRLKSGPFGAREGGTPAA